MTRQSDAYAALAQHYGELVDPRYANDPIKAEARLKEAVRKVWKEHGKDLPIWVQFYTQKWASAKGLDRTPIPGMAERTERLG